MSQEPEVLLEVEDVEAGYAEIKALLGISLKLRRGQIVTMLGANGAGKTTTLKTISGLVRARAGRIRLMGEDITGMAAHDIARMGLVHVPEGRHILRGLTVQENLELGAFAEKSADKRRVQMDEVYDLFPILRDRRKQDGSLLSGGEQQMLAMGRALMQKPKVLLLDEPSMGLAPKLVTETMKIVKRLNEDGASIVLVEQNARVALRLANYGYVLETGKIRMENTAAKLREDASIIEAYLGE